MGKKLILVFALSVVVVFSVASNCPAPICGDGKWKVDGTPSDLWGYEMCDQSVPAAAPWHCEANETCINCVCVPETPTITPATVTPTECQVVMTECPAVATECPVSATSCPAIATQCSVGASTITACAVVATECPATVTESVQIATECPATVTECVDDPTYCPMLTVCGGEGCTPGYWKQTQHFGNWTAPYTPRTKFDAVFADAFGEKTLLQVLWQGGGGLNALGRHAVAALLNAASADVDYDMSVEDVIEAFNDAYASGDYEDAKNELEDFNEQGCPLGVAYLMQ
jgi:hypothetical protein